MTEQATINFSKETNKRLSMARILLPSLFITISILISFASVLATVDGHHDFAKTVDRKSFGLRKEKLSHFRFYWHDVLSGRSPTSMTVIPPAQNTSTGFGMMNMIDNPLTKGPELSSQLLGKAQGFYAQASQKEIGLLMAMNFVFTQGKYNGSTITVLGRNNVFNEVREMPVIGGSGLFRFSRGYVQAKTHWFDMKSGDATVEYNVYVLHY